jgi:hypothetical protein
VGQIDSLILVNVKIALDLFLMEELLVTHVTMQLQGVMIVHLTQMEQTSSAILVIVKMSLTAELAILQIVKLEKCFQEMEKIVSLNAKTEKVLTMDNANGVTQLDMIDLTSSLVSLATLIEVKLSVKHAQMDGRSM